jgi:hypothetical protein
VRLSEIGRAVVFFGIITFVLFFVLADIARAVTWIRWAFG